MTGTGQLQPINDPYSVCVANCFSEPAATSLSELESGLEILAAVGFPCLASESDDGQYSDVKWTSHSHPGTDTVGNKTSANVNKDIVTKVNLSTRLT